jgi:amino-acid N-acetyltransferase
MLDIDIRAATPQDWPAIAALLQACALPLEGAREHLDDFVVASRSGTIVGTAGLEVYGDSALLRSVAVPERDRNTGIGRALLDSLMAAARRRGVSKLYLLTTTAPRYFERFGFRPQDRDLAPAGLKASAEFQGTCPVSAIFMMREVGARVEPTP